MYNANRTYDAKRTFRNNWAKFKIETIKERKVERESFTKSDSNLGTFHPFGKIVLEEGGWQDPSAVRAATKYATKALGLGGDWVKWNEFTERWEFRYVKTSQLDVYENRWAHHR
eukprot:10961662-Alexandrium_andersonii.AAC.1